MADRTASLPVSRDRRAAIIRGKVLRAAMYGIEAAEYNESDYVTLTAAILRALTNGAAQKMLTSHLLRAHSAPILIRSCKR